MSNSIVIKYFIQDDVLYELVYKVDDSLSKSLPGKVKHEYESRISDTIQKALSDLSDDIAELSYDDCTDAGRASTPKLSHIESSLNQSLEETQEKAASIFYKHLPLEKVAPKTGAGTILIEACGEHRETFDDFLEGLGSQFLPDEEKETFDNLATPFEKLECLKTTFEKIRDKSDKARFLEALKKDFDSYLKNPSALIELDPVTFSQIVSLVGMLIEPVAQDTQTVWVHLHKMLKDNHELRDNLKIFQHESIASRLLLKDTEKKLEDAKQIFIEELDNPSDKQIASTLKDYPDRAAATTIHFFQNLDAFISKGIDPRDMKRWSLDPTLRTLDLEECELQEGADVTVIQNCLYNKAKAEVDVYSEAEYNREITPLKTALTDELLKDLQVCLKIADAEGNIEELDLVTQEDLDAFTQDLQPHQQLYVYNLLRQESLKSLENIRFEGSAEDAKVQNLKEKITLVIDPSKSVCALIEKEFVPYLESKDTKKYSDIVRKTFMFDIPEDIEDLKYHQKIEVLPIQAGDPIEMYLSLEALSKRKEPQKFVDLI